jgi:MFS family permease
MTGPAIGAVLAIIFGFRGAIAASAVLPPLSAAAVYLLVPRDRITPRAAVASGEKKRRDSSISSLFTAQFGIILAVYCFIYAASQLTRIAAPIAMEHASGHPPSKALVGVAFTLADVASVLGLFGISRRTSTNRFRLLIVVFILVSGVSTALLGATLGAPVWIFAFCIASLALAAMIPAINTIIAALAGRERRGTAFGVASSAQSLAFIVGPLGGAFFEATSMMFGFFVLGLAFLVMGGIAARFLKEPELQTHEPDLRVEPV